MQKLFFSLILIGVLSSCAGQNPDDSITVDQEKTISEVDKYYTEHIQDSLPSISNGIVSKGSLENGTLIPFSGKNYIYFDTGSYLNGRAFTNRKVAESILAAYDRLSIEGEKRMFRVMELSNEHGGKLFPHRTHQNGLSVDFMMPLIKDGKPYYDLDSKGASHYFLEFNNDGEYISDTDVSIDFNTVARHILLLDNEARKRGLKISKVIINTNLKDELYDTSYGTLLKSKGIYVVRNLEPLINDLHDDHYHIDFSLI